MPLSSSKLVAWAQKRRRSKAFGTLSQSKSHQMQEETTAIQPALINDDILIKILHHLVFDDLHMARHGKQQVYLLHCTHVCRYWRHVAINTPSLWVFVPLVHASQQRHKEDHTQKVLQMRLVRAGPSADLFILMRYTPSTDNLQNRGKFLNLFDREIQPNLHRCREIEIFHDSAVIHKLLVQNVKELQTIRTLFIHSKRGSKSLRNESQKLYLNHECTLSSLQVFHLHNKTRNLEVEASFFPQTLRSLCLRSHFSTLSQVHAILKAVSPTLESLSLAVTYTKDHEGALPPITFPVLSYIAICGIEKCGTPPRLCSSFEVFGTVEGDASLQFPCLSSCMITAVPLEPKMQEDAFQRTIDFLHQLPGSIHTLQFQTWSMKEPSRMWDRFLDALTIADLENWGGGRTVLFSKLYRVYFYECHGITEEAIRRFMASRQSGAQTDPPACGRIAQVKAYDCKGFHPFVCYSGPTAAVI
ncbi:hypothetical protein CPB86DRAFT_870990 [Serendipita vermifera]|nr:hypothetical protein CPB86DRAFT_870990 [Serendipita vermifera]